LLKTEKSHFVWLFLLFYLATFLTTQCRENIKEFEAECTIGTFIATQCPDKCPDRQNNTHFLKDSELH